jgi:hypothetical protein
MVLRVPWGLRGNLQAMQPEEPPARNLKAKRAQRRGSTGPPAPAGLRRGLEQLGRARPRRARQRGGLAATAGAATAGRDVHVHEFEREWTLKDRPLADVQFDPFLWWPGDKSRNL